MVPERLQRKFNSSYDAVEDNLKWFKTNHRTISLWSNDIVRRLGLDDPVPVLNTTTQKSFTPQPSTPQPSSAPLNDLSHFMFSLPILFSLVFSVFNLF